MERNFLNGLACVQGFYVGTAVFGNPVDALGADEDDEGVVHRVLLHGLDSADLLAFVGHTFCLLVHHGSEMFEGGTFVPRPIYLPVDRVNKDRLIVSSAPHHVFDIGVNLKELGLNIITHVLLSKAASHEHGS